MKSNFKRITELDGLRGIAVIAVLLYHYLFHYDVVYGHQIDSIEIFRYGFYGVHLFFLVSGFVIFWTVSRSQKPLDFVWSRFSRLYPPFWIALFLTFIAVSVFSLPNREVDISTFFLNFFMFHEYFGIGHVDGVYWTLTIELAFYFWIFLIFCSGQIKNIEKILIIWIITSSSISIIGLDEQIDPRFTSFFILDYIELFAAGICFYKYKSKNHSIYTHITITLAILSIYLSYTIKISLGICFLYLLFWFVTMGKIRILGSKPLVYLGNLSYSLYLIHQNIGYIILNKSYLYGYHPLIGVLTAFMVSLLLAHLIMIYIEQPSLRKLRKYYESNKTLNLIREKLYFSRRNKLTR